VPCQGPFERFLIEREKEVDMKKMSSSRNLRDRMGATGSAGSRQHQVEAKQREQVLKQK